MIQPEVVKRRFSNLETRKWLTDLLWYANKEQTESIQFVLRACERYENYHLRWHVAGGRQGTFADSVQAARVGARRGVTPILGVGDGQGNWVAVDVPSMTVSLAPR